MKYMKEIHGDLLIRMLDDGAMERYDFSAKTWVEDQSMVQVFYGGILATTISEKEAEEIIMKSE